MLGAGLQIPKILIRGLLPPDDGWRAVSEKNHMQAQCLENYRVQVCTLRVYHVLVILHISVCDCVHESIQLCKNLTVYV